jgi:hypothetical protein
MQAQPKSVSALQAQLDTERRMVSFDSYDMSVRQLYEMFQEEAISVPPEYQRQFVWEEARESELIESIFLGIPVPSLFMATNADSTWEIVDGVQRLSTLVHFVAEPSDILTRIGRTEPLKVKGLEKLTEFNGSTYASIPKSLQLAFQTRPIRVTVLNDKSDLNVRFDLFERLNTGGVSLTNQEIRNCIFRGPLNEQLKKLAKSPNFRTVVRLKASEYQNGTAEEFVLRFFSYFENRLEFEHSVKGFFNAYMKANASKKIATRSLNLFNSTMSALAGAFPQGVTRGQSTTTSAILYEALAIGVADALAEGISVKKQDLVALVSDGKLRRLTTGATNSRSMLLNRIAYVKNHLSA